MNTQEVVKFINNDIELNVQVSPDEDTVWLSANQMAELFCKDEKTIRKHINNIFSDDELNRNNNTQKMRVDGVKQSVSFYTLDVIISVGYRVKSKEGIIFRKWANKILKQYMLKGYVINANKFSIPNIEEITHLLEQARISTGSLQLTSDDMLDFLLVYNKGLTILDNYDHQTMDIESSMVSTYVINYEECMRVIQETTFSDKGDLFGLEKSDSFKSAIETIYQTFGGVELYPTLEDKAANLLYLVTKNHAFADGNKRIAATIFLYFLEKNKVLYINNKHRISNTTLATLTILVASSNPKDKESIINLIKLILFG